MARILVVEDDPAICACLEGDLRLEGYDVELQSDGVAASARIKEAAFDLIILDVMLPGKDGFEVCREARRCGVKVPVLMLTARSEVADKVIGLETGADDYVTKPFSPRELRARIKALLRRTSISPMQSYQFGDAIVDFGRYEIRRGGKPIDLTPLELRLLTALIRAKGRTLTRGQLLDDVWGEGTFVSDRVVDNHITHLRKKIEPDPASPRHVVSVRGVGYRFED
jgi:two-component system alkaline phosphatase synthesis response regulator PhoP